MDHEGKMAGAQPIFFKKFRKNDLRFSRSLRKKDAESKNHPLSTDIHTSDFAGSLPRCDPNFSHTKVAILGGIQQSLTCVYRMKKGCSLIQHPFFSNSMKSANRFFDIFRKKLAEWEGRPHSPVGKLAVGKDGEGKGREKRKETYQNSRKMKKSNEFGQRRIPWTVPYSGEKKK